MDRGRVDGVIRVLPGFARDIERGRPTSVQVLLDGTNSNAASIVSGYAGQTIARFTSDVMAERQREKLVAAGVPDSSGDSAGVHRNARLVQSRAEEPELFHPGRDRQHHHAGDPVADHHGHCPGKRVGDHGAAYGHADPPLRADPRQDAALRADRLLGHAAGAGGVPAGISHPVRRQFLAVMFRVAAVHPDHAGRRPA